MKKYLFTFVFALFLSSFQLEARLSFFEAMKLNTMMADYQKNPFFYKSYEDTTLQERIIILEKSIEMVTYNLKPEQKKRQFRMLLGIGLCTFLLIAIPGIKEIYTIFTEHKEFLNKRFETIYLSPYIFSQCSSTKINVKDKRYLRKFKVQNIEIHDKALIDKLSYTKKQQLTYYALKYETDKQKSDIISKFSAAIGLFARALMVSSPALFGAYYGDTINKNTLKRYQELYDLLKEEEQHRFSLSPKSI